MPLDFGEVFYHSIENLEDEQPDGTTLDIVIDSKVCVTGHLGDTKACEAVWTKNKGLIKSIEGYLIHDFFIAEIDKKFGNEIDKAFGPNLAKLRKKYDH
jgi:thiamine monophosphate kinase